MRALATAATRTATACSWLRARDGDVRGDAMGQRGYRAGKLAIDSYSLGGYWTHIGPGGWYTDTVIMGSHLKVNPKSTAGIPRPPRAAPSPRRSKRDCRSRSSPT